VLLNVALKRKSFPKKQFTLSMLALLLILTLLPSNFASAASNSLEEQQVTQTVNNFFKSLVTQDHELYLNSIANANNPIYQDLANNLEKKDIDYKIIGLTKVNNTKYQVEVSKKEDGKQYPVIPYDVILQDNQWKFDFSNIIIYPKELLSKEVLPASFYENVISENDTFLVKKTLNIGNIVLFSSLDYDINKASTHIYLPGSVQINTYPGKNNESSWKFVAELYKVYESGNTMVQMAHLSATSNDSVSWSGVYGYHVANVWCDGNSGYLDVGKYKVTW